MTTELNNMRDLLKAACRHWYYFLIAGVLFSIIGGIFYLTTPKSFNTNMLYHFREDEQGRMFFTHENAMQRTILTRGYDIRVSDEQERMNSHALMRDVILRHGLQMEVRKKVRCRYEGVWPCQTITIDVPEGWLQYLRETVVLKITKKQDGYSIRCKVRRKHSSFKVASLDEPLELPLVGSVKLLDNGMQVGEKYKITLSPVGAACDAFCASIKSDRCGEDNHIMLLSATTDMPQRTEFIMNEMVGGYNRTIIEDRQRLAQQASTYLGERIDSTAAEIAAIKKDAAISAEKRDMLILTKKEDLQQLMARQNDLAFAQVYSLDPIDILDGAYTEVKPAGPRASIVCLIILLLTICVPMIVIYIQEVFKGE